MFMNINNEINHIYKLHQKIYNKFETVDGDDKEELIKRYQMKLNDLLTNNWDGQLGGENELEDNLLPGSYIESRIVKVNELKDKLNKFGGKLIKEKGKGIHKDQKKIEKYTFRYSEILEQLLFIEGFKRFSLGPEELLPSDYMPEIYHKYYKKFYAKDCLDKLKNIFVNWVIATKEDKKMFIEQYNKTLKYMINKYEWNELIGEEYELPDEYLPEEYVDRRGNKICELKTKIERLDQKLSVKKKLTEKIKNEYEEAALKLNFIKRCDFKMFDKSSFPSSFIEKLKIKIEQENEKKDQRRAELNKVEYISKNEKEIERLKRKEKKKWNWV